MITLMLAVPVLFAAAQLNSYYTSKQQYAWAYEGSELVLWTRTCYYLVQFTYVYSLGCTNPVPIYACLWNVYAPNPSHLPLCPQYAVSYIHNNKDDIKNVDWSFGLIQTANAQTTTPPPPQSQPPSQTQLDNLAKQILGQKAVKVDMATLKQNIKSAAQIIQTAVQINIVQWIKQHPGQQISASQIQALTTTIKQQLGALGLH